MHKTAKNMENIDDCIEEIDQVDIKVELPNMSSIDNATNGYHLITNNGRISSLCDINAIGGSMNLWTSKATSCLISEYKKYRSLVGQTTKLRSLREMFEIISMEMQKHNFYFSPQKCENKWRVLERKYKNLVYRERVKKPGRMRHYGHWEHKRALDEIFREKNRHAYLDESELLHYKLPSNKARKKANGVNKNEDECVNSDNEDPLAILTDSASAAKEDGEEISDKQTQTMFVKFCTEMTKNFSIAEKNKERRHQEMMTIRQSELEVQTKLLKLMELNMELKKKQVITAAQLLQSNL